MIHTRRTVGVLCLLVAGALPAAAESKAILVLDASGSMWGRIDGTPKIEIARSVVGELLGDWETGVELGVMAYGHRRKGDCNDIEMIVPVGPVDRATVTNAVNGLNPKGKTPISAAIRQAAEKLRYTEEKATVILVSDGKETCEEDPCALAAELEKLGIDFTAHVIAFDLDEAEARTLECIAKNSGGRFLRAGDAAQLTTALGTAVAAVAKPAPKPVSVAKPKPMPEPGLEPGLYLSAVLAEGAEPFTERVTYTVYKSEKDLKGNRERVTYAIDPTAHLKLPTGRYYVTAAYQQAFADMEVDVVAEEAQKVVMNLNAGLLAVSSVLTDGAEPFDQRVTYTVLRAVSDIKGTREERVTYAIDPSAQFYLPAGEYRVKAEYQTAGAETSLTVEANQRTEHVFDLNAGLLAVSSVLTDGAEPFDQRVTYTVLRAVSDIKGTREERVTYGIDPAVQFYLTAGTYKVRAEYATTNAEATLEVRPNQRTEHVFDLNAGLLAASARLAPGVPMTERVTYSVHRTVSDLAGPKRVRVTYGIDPTVDFYLTAGTYDVTAEYQTARTQRSVTIQPNQRTEEVFDLNAGFVRIYGTQGGAPITERATFTVYASTGGTRGERVTYGIDPSVSFYLSAGSYVVAAQLGSIEESVEVTVTAGQSQEVPIELR